MNIEQKNYVEMFLSPFIKKIIYINYILKDPFTLKMMSLLYINVLYNPELSRYKE